MSCYYLDDGTLVLIGIQTHVIMLLSGCRLHDGTLVLIGIQTHVIMLLSGCRIHDGKLVLIGSYKLMSLCYYLVVDYTMGHLF